MVVEALLQDKAYRHSLKAGLSAKVPIWLKLWSRLKAVLLLGILYFITLPLSALAVALLAFLEASSARVQSANEVPPGSRGTALVSGRPSTTTLFPP